MHQVFPHQGPYHQQQQKQQQAQQSEWQQQQQHHSQHNQHHGQYASQAANAAAQQQQQQQHYARGSMNANLPNSNNNLGNAGSLLGQGVNNAIGGIGGGPQADHGGNMMTGGPGGPGGDANLSDENRRVLEWIAQVLSTNAREAALLELSKKREQVPELALILWHSFGEWKGIYDVCVYTPSHLGVDRSRGEDEGKDRMTDSRRCRRDDFSLARDHFRLSSSQPFATHCCCF
jgi:CCR4-NOT transcription complex subunit 9